MRLIDADALKKAIIEHRDDYIDDNFFWTKLFNIIDNAPTVKIPVARWDSYCEGQRVGYDKCIDTIIKLFNKYIPLLVHIDGKISPVKNTSKQECYDLLYEIQELIEWRKLLYKNNMEANNEDHD